MRPQKPATTPPTTRRNKKNGKPAKPIVSAPWGAITVERFREAIAAIDELMGVRS